MRPRYPNEAADGKLCIVEGVSGMWHYHVAPVDSRHIAVCGAHTMLCHLPWDQWGAHGGNIPSSYCKKCAGQRGESES